MVGEPKVAIVTFLLHHLQMTRNQSRMNHHQTLDYLFELAESFLLFIMNLLLEVFAMISGFAKCLGRGFFMLWYSSSRRKMIHRIPS